MKLLKILAASIILSCTGCQTLDSYNSLPPEKRAEFLKAQAIEFLESNKDGFKRGLILGGMEAMEKAVSDSERKTIASQMYASAVAFRSLATGQAFTSDQVTKTILSFAPDQSIPSWIKFSNDIGLGWAVLYPKFNLSQNQQLIIDYFVLAAEAAEQVGAAYKGGS